MCRAIQKRQPAFDGSDVHLFDSFEGLPSEKFAKMFACPLPQVQEYLSEFPAISYHKGNIPDSFNGIPEMTYRFVHVDLDLAEPSRASFEYFYPRLAQGGIMVCDDYGSKMWQGTRETLDEYVKDKRAFALSTGQLVVIK